MKRVCLSCDSQGFRIVPCRRDDPDRLYPDCRHREFPTPSGGCSRPGCMEAVKVVMCPCGLAWSAA